MTELWIPNQSADSTEMTMVRNVTGLDPSQLHDADLDEFNGYVTIVSCFSRINPGTGQLETISPSRAEAIPAISARFCRLVEAARGQLSTDELVKEWSINMPENDSTRHPDLLFDIAQYNFGHDGPIDDIIRGLTLADIRRKELIETYRSHFRHSLAQLRHEHSKVDVDEEFIDELIDSI